MKRSPLLFSLAVLLLGVVVAVVVADHVRARNAEEIASRFEVLSDRIVASVTARIKTYEYGLRGARGAVIAGGGPRITRMRFRQYAESRELDREFPGARGYGFIRRVAEGDEAAFLAAAATAIPILRCSRLRRTPANAS